MIEKVKPKKKNPVKVMAVELAHMMDDETRLMEEDLRPWEEEDIRLYCKEVRMKIFDKGYDINELLALGAEYKTKSMLDFRNWIYE